MFKDGGELRKNRPLGNPQSKSRLHFPKNGAVHARMTIRVKVTPNARRDALVGWEDDPRAGRVLRVRLRAPPAEGKANKALVAFLADRLGLPKSALTLVHGQTSRLKTIELPAGTRLP